MVHVLVSKPKHRVPRCLAVAAVVVAMFDILVLVKSTLFTTIFVVVFVAAIVTFFAAAASIKCQEGGEFFLSTRTRVASYRRQLLVQL